MKKNPADAYESIMVLLTEEKTPIAFKTKVKELINSGMTKQEAEKYLKTTPIELELYYSENQGLFGVEAEAVEVTSIFNPYDGSEFEEID